MIRCRLFTLSVTLSTLCPLAAWAQSATTTTTTTTTSSTTTTTTAPPPPPPAPTPPPPPPPPPPPKDAKYEFGKFEALKAVVWKASASLGFSATTGNSNVISLSGGLDISRNDGKNKIALHAEGVYGFTRSLALNDLNGNGLVDNSDELVDADKITAGFFTTKLRYDRFFTEKNTLYIAAFAGFDQPASKQVSTGGQVGYARLILKSAMHSLSAELGYDFTYDRLNPPDMQIAPFAQDIFLHSGRIFIGYGLTVSDHTLVKASVEALINFNPLTIADRAVDVGEASRVNGKLEVTTKIWKPLAFRAAFSARFNNAPSLNTTLMFSPDNPDRYLQKLDTLTELGLVLNFL